MYLYTYVNVCEHRKQKLLTKSLKNFNSIFHYISLKSLHIVTEIRLKS